MDKGNDTRTRIVQTAAHLFQRQGYNATGLNQIVKESGAPKGSLSQGDTRPLRIAAKQIPALLRRDVPQS